MSRYVHLNGELVPADAATVNVRDRGFMYGDAAFETMRAYGGTIFRWDAHADRLDQTCETLNLAHGLDRSTLHERILGTLHANGLEDAYVKLSISRGVQPGTLAPAESCDPTVVIVVRPLPRGGINGSPVWEQPATLEMSDVQGIDDAALPAAAKTHNYLNGILARLDVSTGADEALVADSDGYILEGTTSNCFFAVDGVLQTPSSELSLLPGITRSVIIELASAHNIPVETGRYRPEAVSNADEVFLTNSTWEIRPVSRFGDTEYNRGPITKQLQTAFDEMIETACY